MFIPSILHHSSCKFKCELFVPDTFGVLCWNVHKNNNKQGRFKSYLETIEMPIDFMLFQEANFKNDENFTLENFAFDAAANLEIKKSFYGVLTASKVESNNAKAYLSKRKESFFGTYKSLLFTQYNFQDNETLLILNVHAINFRENQAFNKELEHFLEILKTQKGSLIVAGDFNTWNKKRIQKLHNLKDELGLKMVEFNKNDEVKSFMGNHLDFIFYRGLELVQASVGKKHGLSDHNPLFAQFKKINTKN